VLEQTQSGPRAPDDARMYLYFDYSATGALRWYVRVKRAGKKIRIREEYGTAAFDEAFDAAVDELGGERRMRRILPDQRVSDPRRYVISDLSQRGQLRYYVQLRNKLPKIRIRAEHGSDEFDRLADRAIASQVALYGDGNHEIDDARQPRAPRIEVRRTPPKPGSLRWYWTEYQKSDAWLGNLSVGEKGLKPTTRHQRVLLVEPLLYANGEKRFAALKGSVIRDEMTARTPTQAGNLLSALRGMIGWMVKEKYLDAHDDPTLGIRSGKAAASRESGGFVPWDEADMARYRAAYEVGTEARLMFDVLHYSYMRRGDAHRFGPPHVRGGRMLITTEKSNFKTVVQMKLHPELMRSISLTLTGEKVFTGKLLKGEIVPMTKEAWAAKFKKFAVLAGVNQPGKNCHGVRKARAEDAAYALCTEAQMMSMFGWTDPKMPSHYIAQANRATLGDSGQDRMFARDQSESIAKLPTQSGENGRVTFLGNRTKKAK